MCRVVRAWRDGRGLGRRPSESWLACFARACRLRNCAIDSTVALEEAQTVLAPSATSAEDSPFVSWVKEGRKYGLGAVLVTQQPGASRRSSSARATTSSSSTCCRPGDLAALKRANAHFSDDLLATLLNESLVGHGVFWSSAPGTDRSARPYPLPVRVLSFEAEHRELRDPSYSLGPVDCYAARLRGRFRGALAAAPIARRRAWMRRRRTGRRPSRRCATVRSSGNDWPAATGWRGARCRRG